MIKKSTLVFSLLVVALACNKKDNDNELPIPDINAIPGNDSLAIRQSVFNFVNGFTENKKELIESSVAISLMMFNGNFSDDPVKWQTHQYLTGDGLANWIDFMLKEAGPFTNHVEILSSYLRRGSAMVVTVETGSNKFMKWENEKVVYLLGKTNDKWGITGFYIRDIANP